MVDQIIKLYNLYTNNITFQMFFLMAENRVEVKRFKLEQ